MRTLHIALLAGAAIFSAASPDRLHALTIEDLDMAVIRECLEEIPLVMDSNPPGEYPFPAEYCIIGEDRVTLEVLARKNQNGTTEYVQWSITKNRETRTFPGSPFAVPQYSYLPKFKPAEGLWWEKDLGEKRNMKPGLR